MSFGYCSRTSQINVASCVDTNTVNKVMAFFFLYPLLNSVVKFAVNDVMKRNDGNIPFLSFVTLR